MNLQDSILKVLAYFDVFNYPVTLEEIKFFLDQKVNDDDLTLNIQQLLDKQLIWKYGEFYILKNEFSLVERRVKGNKYAIKRLKQAKKISAILVHFPFVRGIGISGSLSKNFAYEGSDLDFFIITAKDRLWIARSFLHFFIS